MASDNTHLFIVSISVVGSLGGSQGCRHNVSWAELSSGGLRKLGFQSSVPSPVSTQPSSSGEQQYPYTWDLTSASVQFSHSVMSLCNPIDCSMPGLPIYHQLPEFTQSHVH